MNAKKLMLVGLPMIAVTYGLSRFSFGLMIPSINETMNIKPTTSGLISSLSYVAYCIAIVLAMVFSNKITPKSILVIAGFSSIIGLGIIAISPNPLILGLGVFLAGMSTGYSSPPYADIVSKNIETQLQNKTNSWINSGTSIGTASTGIIALVMADSWRETYVIFMVIAIFVLIGNYLVLPKKQPVEKISTVRFSKKEWKRATPLVIASFFIGVACSAYWTFSRDFLVELESMPVYFKDWLWVIIGISGLLGGTAGAFIDKFGLTRAYLLSVSALSTSSLILGLYPGNFLSGFLSPALFGSSYIFMTAVLIVWGITVFKTNPSFGLGIPFLTLALGQAIGSIFSGIVADLTGYHVLFIGASLLGYLTLFLKFKENKFV
ncbi:MFS transporter [Oceanobacillus kapialis]|uniref:MFS transporter n=1 Tax=Oceanobacillus kapialis TaxID=481353 RepID=A0ABW5Q2T5_9BACI